MSPLTVVVSGLLGLSREVTVPVDEAGARFDDLLDEIEQGAHVVLVQDGKRVAVMMSWPTYVDLREKLASMAAAFWSAWRSGVFDVAGYATDVTRVLHVAPGRSRTRRRTTGVAPRRVVTAMSAFGDRRRARQRP